MPRRRDASRSERLPDGTPVESVVLTGANGVSARIMSLGATLQALNAPDRSGRIADVTLGYDDARSYVEHPNYWGQTIGRYANRIAGGRFTLDGKAYRLTLNDKTNSLHGGYCRFRQAQLADRGRERQGRSRQGRASADERGGRPGLSRQSDGHGYLYAGRPRLADHRFRRKHRRADDRQP